MKLNDGLSLDLYNDHELSKSKLHDIHLKIIPTIIKNDIWKVEYKYKTVRGNKKENYRYVVAKDSTDAKFNLLDYINNFNKNNQHRSLLNVKILDVKYVGQLKQEY